MKIYLKILITIILFLSIGCTYEIHKVKVNSSGFVVDKEYVDYDFINYEYYDEFEYKRDRYKKVEEWLVYIESYDTITNDTILFIINDDALFNKSFINKKINISYTIKYKLKDNDTISTKYRIERYNY